MVIDLLLPTAVASATELSTCIGSSCGNSKNISVPANGYLPSIPQMSQLDIAPPSSLPGNPSGWSLKFSAIILVTLSRDRSGRPMKWYNHGVRKLGSLATL